MPPVTQCLWGYYRGDSYNTTAPRWTDLSGSGHHATLLRGTPKVDATLRGSASYQYVYGAAATDGIRFGTSFTRSTGYTLFHIAR